jgi:hypothetical protein
MLEDFFFPTCPLHCLQGTHGQNLRMRYEVFVDFNSSSRRIERSYFPPPPPPPSSSSCWVFASCCVCEIQVSGVYSVYAMSLS